MTFMLHHYYVVILKNIILYDIFIYESDLFSLLYLH